MSDDKNPEEKPSFFDSGEESKSWPPADNYELDNKPTNDNAGESFFDSKDDFSNPFQENEDSDYSPNQEEDFVHEVPGLEKPADSATANTEDFLDSDDYLDQLIDNVDEKNNINNMRIVDDEAEDIDFTQASETIIEPEILSSEEIDSNQVETDASYDEDLNQDLNLENLVNENELQEPVIAEEDEDDDFDLDDLIEDDFISSTDNESVEPKSEDPFEDSILVGGIGATSENTMAFSDDPEGITNNESGFEEQFVQEEPRYDEQNFQTQTSFEDGYAESEFVDIVDDDDNDSSELKPFRTFTKINLAEELADEKEEEEEAGGVLAGVNRNVLIIVAIIILSLGYFLFNMFFNKKIEQRSRQRRRPPKKERTFNRSEQILSPVWEVASQKTKNPELEDKYAKSLVKFTGRENPFAMPQSVIDALKRQADLALLAKKKPNTYKRNAYRATLLGVLTSEGSTIALVNVQEANFDVIEGTTKNKVLKLATKSMDKAKKNTLEMSRGSFVGPWEIVSVAAPSGAFADAKITVEYRGTQKVLSMGKAEDLGIFDAAGQLDNLESTQNEFEDDDFDDDF